VSISVEQASKEDREGRFGRRPSEDVREIRAPRLLVAASEISWRALVVLAAIVVVIFGLLKIGFVAIPIMIALLLSTLFVPPARWLQRRGLPAALATSIVFLIGIFALVGVVAGVSAAIASEADTLSRQVSGGADELGELIAGLPFAPDEAEIQRQIDSVDDRIREHSASIRDGVLAGAQAAGQFLAGLAIMLVVLFFFVKDGPKMWTWLCGLFPPERRDALDDMGERSWHVLTAYVRGVVVVALVDAVGIGIGLWIIGVPLVLPLAVITFLLAFVPIVGAYVAGAAATLVALVSIGPVAALATVGVVVLVQQLESHVLYPWIVGRTVELHPLVVLLSVAIGGVLYGIVGAALAVPLALLATAAVSVVQRHSVHGEVAVGPPPIQEPEGSPTTH
jgi:predicted PurR-regulated permease PerM